MGRPDETRSSRAFAESLGDAVADAAGLIDRALSETSDPIERADAKRAAAKLGTWCGDILRTASVTSRAAEEIAGIEDSRAAALWLDAATTLAYSGHLVAGRDAASRAGKAAEGTSRLAAVAQVIESWTAALLGEDVTLGEPDDALLEALGDDDVRVGVLLAGLLVWTGRHDEARRLLGRVEAHAEVKAPDTLPFVLGVVADLDTRSGWWRSADEAIMEAESRSTRTRSPSRRSSPLAATSASNPRARPRHRRASRAVQLAAQRRSGWSG